VVDFVLRDRIGDILLVFTIKFLVILIGEVLFGSFGNKTTPEEKDGLKLFKVIASFLLTLGGFMYNLFYGRSQLAVGCSLGGAAVELCVLLFVHMLYPNYEPYKKYVLGELVNSFVVFVALFYYWDQEKLTEVQETEDEKLQLIDRSN
jgi:hypothetical protein